MTLLVYHTGESNLLQLQRRQVEESKDQIIYDSNYHSFTLLASILIKIKSKMVKAQRLDPP
jgi:hypothetical protein